MALTYVEVKSMKTIPFSEFRVNCHSLIEHVRKPGGQSLSRERVKYWPKSIPALFIWTKIQEIGEMQILREKSHAVDLRASETTLYYFRTPNS
jgi:hypothetical protein